MSVSSDSTTLAAPSLAVNTVTSQPADSTTAARLSYLNTFNNDIANSWLLPDGVADVLFEEAQKQEVLRYQLTQQLITHGYQLVCPPMIEFTESLLSDASEDLKRQTFKIIDQLSGRLMGLRADITPQILRIDTHWGGEGVARYCYAGHVVHTLPSGLFGSRIPLQLGAEIFGCASQAADIELIDVLFTMIKGLNLSATLHLDLGHVAIFKRLAVMAQLTASDTEHLMHLYTNKNLPELKSVCQSLPMGDDFYALARFGHDMATLSAKLSSDAQQDTQITEALDELQGLKAHLENHWQCEVSIDVTELSGYHYHTGIVFNGYMNSETQPLVRGGRFDGLQKTHQSDEQPPRAATGFSMDVSRLLAHTQLDTPMVVIVDYSAMTNADAAQQNTLKENVERLRQQGYRVTMPLDCDDCPKEVTHRLDLQNNDWQLITV